jgi:exodeoxyribonuclease VII small subunit
MEAEIKFEKAIEKLETIVEALESGNMPLDDALKKYEEGVKLSRACSAKLEQAETKIEVLTRTLSGKEELDSNDAVSNTKKVTKKKQNRAGKSDASFDSDLLL